MSELAKALCEYQRQTGGFEADKKGNRSQYASIGAVINNVKQANAFGLTFTQEVDFEDDMMFVRTVMMHTSGEARISRLPVVPTRQDQQPAIRQRPHLREALCARQQCSAPRRVSMQTFRMRMMTVKQPACCRLKQVPPKPAATAPEAVSLSGVAGHSPGGGLQPAVGAFSDPAIVAAAPDDRVEETLAKVTEVAVLEAAFRQRGGTKQPDNIVKMFGNRKKELMNV